MQSTERSHARRELIVAEEEFLSLIRITESFDMHDTLTVCPSLVQSADKFFNMTKEIINSNYLRVPLELRLESGCFENYYPVWFDQEKQYSIASWLLLYFERALNI